MSQMGGLGYSAGANLGFSGLSAFLGAGAVPVMDPLTSQGLQTSAQMISYVAKGNPNPANELPFNEPQNMQLWADWVRSSLYLTEFVKQLDWQPHANDRKFEIQFNNSTIFSIYKPEPDTFKQQLQLIEAYAEQRSERSAEILSQLGLPTQYFAMILGLHVARNPKTYELITISQVLASHIAMIVKHNLAVRRPDRIGAKVLPMIPTPGHGSFPSAHATEAFTVATVLQGLLKASGNHYPDLDDRIELIFKQAERIAVSRTVAGVHFPIDSWAGAILGRVMGQSILAMCGVDKDGKLPVSENNSIFGISYNADAAIQKGLVDFSVAEYKKDISDLESLGITQHQSETSISPSPLFVWLWKAAKSEFEISDGA